MRPIVQLTSKLWRTTISEVFVRGVLALMGLEFHVASILKKQLKVLCVQAKLTEAAANVAGGVVVCRRSGPALISGLMDELEKTAVAEEQGGLGVFGVDDVVGRTASREISHCTVVHFRTV